MLDFNDLQAVKKAGPPNCKLPARRSELAVAC